LGTIKVKGDVAGVQEVLFVKSALEIENTVPSCLVPCVEQLQQYFAGKRHTFDFKMNPQGTDFQKMIWVLLKNLPFGSTISYLKLARLYGNTKAVRAVAAAVGKNPILVAIPCHRVIGSDGTLVGYAGGIDKKETLLELEGFPVQKKLI
jgi:methylated-DNA-[protein]-cysteine S-methyltransferase